MRHIQEQGCEILKELQEVKHTLVETQGVAQKMYF